MRKPTISKIIEDKHNNAIIMLLYLCGRKSKTEIYTAVSSNPRMSIKLDNLVAEGIITMTKEKNPRERSMVDLTPLGVKYAEGLCRLETSVGGDVEAGLAIAEMIASLSKPTVSLVLGGSHSIGGPLAVSADYSFIVPTGTMIVHPVRSTGMFIGVIQSYRNMEKTQDRIARFIAEHSKITQERLLELMLDSTQLVKDVGTMLEGADAVREGLIDEVGGISQAFAKLHEMIEERRKNL